MYIYGAKFQEHCFNISRDIVYSVFYHFQLQTIWRHHWSNLHNRKTSISLKLREIFQKEKRHSSVFWKAFQISRKNFSCHMHFKGKSATWYKVISFPLGSCSVFLKLKKNSNYGGESQFKVPISSKCWFSYLILHITQWTSAKEKFDLDKMQSF